MSTFDLLETKRKHVKKYSDKIPPKEIIERSLYKAWKTTPSKNNSMAYQVLVWGPDKQLHKEAIHRLVVTSHKAAEDRAVEEGIAETTQKGVPNPYYEHIKYNPYLFTIHSRVSTPNKFYKREIENGHFYDQGFESHIERIADSVAVEVGLFAGNLSNYLLEEGLDLSYNSCFRRDKKEWPKVGLHMVTNRPFLMISCGYGERYRRQDLEKWNMVEDDRKPEQKDIIKWM